MLISLSLSCSRALTHTLSHTCSLSFPHTLWLQCVSRCPPRMQLRGVPACASAWACLRAARLRARDRALKTKKRLDSQSVVLTLCYKTCVHVCDQINRFIPIIFGSCEIRGVFCDGCWADKLVSLHKFDQLNTQNIPGPANRVGRSVQSWKI